MMIRVLLVRFRLLTMVASAPLAIGVVTESAGAQSSAKRPLEIADYRLWRQIDGEQISDDGRWVTWSYACLLYTSPSPRDLSTSRMPSSA